MRKTHWEPQRNNMPTRSGKAAVYDIEYTPFRYLCRHNSIWEINLKCTSDAPCSGKTWKHVSPEKQHKDVYVDCTVLQHWDKTPWTKNM